MSEQTVFERVGDAMKTAMKAGEKDRLLALRSLKAAIMKREADEGSLPDATAQLQIVQSLVKQRRDSIEQFTAANRLDLADKEKAELKVLEEFLPTQMSQADIEAIVIAAIQETGASGSGDLGKVMKVVRAQTQGKADGKLVSDIVKAKLA